MHRQPNDRLGRTTLLSYFVNFVSYESQRESRNIWQCFISAVLLQHTADDSLLSSAVWPKQMLDGWLLIASFLSLRHDSRTIFTFRLFTRLYPATECLTLLRLSRQTLRITVFHHTVIIVIIQCLCCHLQKDRWPITTSTFGLITDSVIIL